MHVDVKSLTGERAELIPMESSHVAALFKAGIHPDIWTYMPRRVTSTDDMKSIVDGALAQRAQGTEFPFSIVDRETGEIVGSSRLLDISTVDRSLEIGWTWLSPTVWRTRINTECKYLLLKYSFETLGVIRVQLKTDARNLRSQAAIERIGAVREGVLRKHRILWDGYIRDSVYYSILDNEWPQVKANLEAGLERSVSSPLPHPDGGRG